MILEYISKVRIRMRDFPKVLFTFLSFVVLKLFKQGRPVSPHYHHQFNSYEKKATQQEHVEPKGGGSSSANAERGLWYFCSCFKSAASSTSAISLAMWRRSQKVLGGQTVCVWIIVCRALNARVN